MGEYDARGKVGPAASARRALLTGTRTLHGLGVALRAIAAPIEPLCRFTRTGEVPDQHDQESLQIGGCRQHAE
jgi:hypothetical protein